MPFDAAPQSFPVAIELSASSWVVAARVPGRDKCRLFRCEAGDTGELARILDEVARLAGPAASPAVCFEAGRDGFWRHRWLTDRGVAAHVVEPTSILVRRQARRAKTDRLDAEGLVRVLAGWLAGGSGICRMVGVPTVGQEDAKRPHREREQLVQERTRIENRLLALLATRGIRRRPSLRNRTAAAAARRTGDGRPLPPHLHAEIERLRRRLGLILELPREVEADMAEAAAVTADPTADPTAGKVAMPRRIRGVGANFAAVLAREVFYRRFAGRRRLAGYAGLTPMPFQSGSVDRDRRIRRAGNPRARTTMIQPAWPWLRYQPGSALAGWFRDRVGALAGRIRRIAIVALARKLLVALWSFVETGAVPDGIVVSPRPAHQAARRSRRTRPRPTRRGARPSSSMVTPKLPRGRLVAPTEEHASCTRHDGPGPRRPRRL